MPKPSCKDCGKKCCPKVAFIGLDTKADLGSAIPYIDAAREFYPVEKLVYDFVPVTPAKTDNQSFQNFVNTVLAPAIKQLSDKVDRYVKHGFQYIGLPALSRLLGPFIRGHAIDPDTSDIVSIPGFVDVPLSEKYPHVFFMVANLSTSAICGAQNVYRFTDVRTSNDETIVLGNFTAFGITPDASSVVIYVYQSNDPAATQIFESQKAILEAVGITVVPYKFTIDANGTVSSLVVAAQVINDAVNNADISNIVVALSANGIADTQNAFSRALNGQLGPDFFVTSNKVVYYGANFGVVDVPLNADLNSGLGVNEFIPTKFQACLGLPISEPCYFTFTAFIQLDYLEAYVWAATCRKSDGVLGFELKFDDCHTKISEFLSQTITPAGAVLPAAPTTLQFNGRFWGASAIYNNIC